MSVFTSFAGTLSADVAASALPTVQVVTMSLASTEYSIALPANCRQFLVKLRGGAKLQVAYSPGDSGVTYFTVPRNCFYAESDLKLTSTVTLYIQCPVAAQELEVLTWV